ncbi:MAG: DUF1559 domain-containing protein [Phycisphaerales bacterium]|nr:DUF1559 domain-containing protein [Phycisphaerales bacterium]
MDVLVTLSVVAILIGLLLPGLGKARESSRRVVCASNLRQIGLGLVLYADANRDRLPYSIFLERKARDNQIEYAPEDMATLRLDIKTSQRTKTTWDGLGLLYSAEVLPSSGIFYCPSHHAEHSFETYRDRWLAPQGEILGNYHFRGEGPNGSTRLSYIEPSRSALASDSLRSLADYNHEVGLNVLRADLSLFWLADPLKRIPEYLATAGQNFELRDFETLWAQLDQPETSILPDK